jgi:threonine synthase
MEKKEKLMKHIIAAVCIQCGAEYEADDNAYTCVKCGNVLDIKYDYGYIRGKLAKEKLASRTDYSMWRYKELLPVEEDSRLTPLRVGWSPLYKTERLGARLGLRNLYVKDDGQNPTSSLKDRASAIAVVRAQRAGMTTVACSSTGNAASSLAGNAAAMGLSSFIFVPERAPKGKVAQLMIFGARVISVQGNYEETFKLSAQAIERWGWYNRNAAINPYLLEGKKTVSLEIAEQLGFKSPDYVAVSVGDGCTIAGVWKGFKDLFEIGLIDKLPKLISVQADGCCPINRALETGKPIERMEENTIADSIAVGVPRNGEKALRAVRESQGITVNVSDEEIFEAMRLLGTVCGVFGEPAGVTGTAGLKKAAERGLIPPDALTVAIVTGNGLKDTASAQTAAGEPLRIPPDMDILTAEFKKRNIYF